MVNVKDTEPKTSAAKRTITVKSANVKDLRFIDETGDVTAMVLEKIPDSFDAIDVKIVLELPDEEE